MAFSNNMTKLLNKIENRLGMTPLMPYIPEELGKRKWAEIITDDTLLEFSRYFPYKIPYPISRANYDKKTNTYIIDEDFIEGMEILGVADIDFHSFVNDSLYITQDFAHSTADIVSLQNSFNLEDIGLLQMRKDISSLFDNNIFVEYLPPNRFKLSTATNSNYGLNLNKFSINILVKHPDTLLTMTPTIMSLFERLAQSDVAGYLYRTLKYYDGMETVYAPIDLKLDELQEQMSRRDSIIEEIKESYVSASNDTAPIIMTI